MSNQPTSPADSRRQTIRRVAAIVSGILLLVYAVLFVLVRDEELSAGVETTYGAYLFLGIVYAIGVVVLAMRRFDRQAVWFVGALVQVAVIALYLVFGRAADLSVVWGVVTVILQGVLLVLLGYLARTAPAPPARGRDPLG